jgi:hypothetical protein
VRAEAREAIGVLEEEGLAELRAGLAEDGLALGEEGAAPLAIAAWRSSRRLGEGLAGGEALHGAGDGGSSVAALAASLSA